MGESKQLRLLAEFVEVLRSVEAPCWLRGGWALDFALGRITRQHEDIDLFAWSKDGDRIDAALERRGFIRAPGPPPERQRNYMKDGEEFHVALIEEDEHGVLRSPGVSEWAWPEGMIGSTLGQLGDLTLAIVPPGVQIELKEIGLALNPNHRYRDKHERDIALLRGYRNGGNEGAAEPAEIGRDEKTR